MIDCMAFDSKLAALAFAKSITYKQPQLICPILNNQQIWIVAWIDSIN